MARTDPSVVVSDSGPIIHLDEIGCLELLEDVGPVLIPQRVWSEVTTHRPCLAADRIACAQVVDVSGYPTPRLQTLADSLGLDAGEYAALILVESRSARMFLCDDAAARLAAESLGLRVHGTIGLLLRSIRRGTRTREQVLDLLRHLPSISTLHISRKLLDEVIATVEQDARHP